MTLKPRSRRGLSLVELMVALTVMTVMTSFAIPSFQRAAEQSRADVAGGNLRTIWSAQRLYRLDNATYASSLETLISAGLLDANFATPNGGTATYTYTIDEADGSTFTATATRATASWTGSFSIDDTGAITGTLSKAGELDISPGFL
jgi:prepilin-type N-terminal cleavage/methylation domain-containing protein